MSESQPVELDEDAMVAALDLAGRAGAIDLEAGYLHDDVPVEKAGWYAVATFQGAQVISENHRGPVEAYEGLARRLLRGAECAHCHKKVTLAGYGAKKCRWTRKGRRWKRGCE